MTAVITPVGGAEGETAGTTPPSTLLPPPMSLNVGSLRHKGAPSQIRGTSSARKRQRRVKDS